MANKIDYKRGCMIGDLMFLERVKAHVDTPTALFRCRCGKEFVTRIWSAQSRDTKSCGSMKVKFVSQPKKNYFSPENNMQNVVG